MVHSHASVDSKHPSDSHNFTNHNQNILISPSPNSHLNYSPYSALSKPHPINPRAFHLQPSFFPFTLPTTPSSYDTPPNYPHHTSDTHSSSPPANAPTPASSPPAHTPSPPARAARYQSPKRTDVSAQASACPIATAWCYSLSRNCALRSRVLRAGCRGLLWRYIFYVVWWGLDGLC